MYIVKSASFQLAVPLGLTWVMGVLMGTLLIGVLRCHEQLVGQCVGQTLLPVFMSALGYIVKKLKILSWSILNLQLTSLSCLWTVKPPEFHRNCGKI